MKKLASYFNPRAREGHNTGSVADVAIQKHPHVRGEDLSRNHRHTRSGETPPRAWGRHAQRWIYLPHVGNTPTCVGKTQRLPSRPGRPWKHPHVRGEDGYFEPPPTPIPETPPRAWGRPHHPPQAKQTDGNTPTCVGKTYVGQIEAKLRKKHPHVRGEDTKTRAGCAGTKEAPPRAWGRHGPPVRPRETDRNTPTCVGKTQRRPQGGAYAEKHPHVRGEDDQVSGRQCDGLETPPRAWGRQSLCEQHWERRRNTPTCVGKTAQ